MRRSYEGPVLAVFSHSIYELEPTWSETVCRIKSELLQMIFLIEIPSSVLGFPLRTFLFPLRQTLFVFDFFADQATRAERSSVSMRFHKSRIMSLIISASCQRSESS